MKLVLYYGAENRNMPIFNISKATLSPIKEVKIDLEREIQSLTEQNLSVIFGLEFVCSEFQHKNLRIDTLTFDEETRSFVVIEYKRDRSFSVIDQGYAYLALMLNNKADFILQYNEKTGKNLRKDDIDWSQTRVLFIANAFTLHQQGAINFKDLPIELWEVKKYDNRTILFNQLEPAETSESIKTVSKDPTIVNVSKEVKKYSIEDHREKGEPFIQELFGQLRSRLLEMDNRITEVPTQAYIAYKIGKQNVVSLHLFRRKIRMDMMRTQPQELEDPEKRVRLMEGSKEFYNQWISEFDVTNADDIEYAMMLARQVYKKNFV